jgi:hypothetical protein
VTLPLTLQHPGFHAPIKGLGVDDHKLTTRAPAHTMH